MSLIELLKIFVVYVLYAGQTMLKIFVLYVLSAGQTIAYKTQVSQIKIYCFLHIFEKQLSPVTF